MKANRNFWPLGVIGVFVLFFAGMAAVVVIASTHQDHLVADNYYEQELKFQGRIDSVDRAQKSGAAIVHDAAAGRLFIKIPSPQLLRKFAGTVELYRPSAPALDRELRLEPGADGLQTINSSELAVGPWTVRVAWTSGGENFYLEQKITVARK